MKPLTLKLGLLFIVLLFAVGYSTNPFADNPASDKPVFEGPVFEGPVFEGPVFEGPVFEGPVFEGKDTLLNPGNYRNWVFVGSNLGLSYASNPRPPQAEQAGRREVFHNLYINPSAYREFASTGKFPEDTMMILEFTTKVEKNEAGLQGLYQGEILGMEASVKDSKRFDGGWAYYGFVDNDGKALAKAQPFPKSSCWECHHEHAATDNVFTQFYPVLRKRATK